MTLRLIWLVAASKVALRNKPEALYNVLRPHPAERWRSGVKLYKLYEEN